MKDAFFRRLELNVTILHSPGSARRVSLALLERREEAALQLVLGDGLAGMSGDWQLMLVFLAVLSIGIGLLYVTAVDPNTTIKVMYDELKRIQSEPVPEKELAGSKSLFLTSYLMENEPTDGQGSMLARAQLLGGDWHLAKTLPERIRAVKAADVQAFAKRYATHLQTTVLGDPSASDASPLRADIVAAVRQAIAGLREARRREGVAWPAR